MAEAQPTSHTAISVLMAILLTAVTTTATPHHSPHPAAEGRDVPDKATVDRVSRWQSAAESHDGGHDSHVTEENSGHPLLKEGRALEDTQKRASCPSGEVEVGVQVRTDGVYLAGTDARVFVQLIGTTGEEGEFHELNDPNANDFEERSTKKYYYCTRPVGDKIGKIGVKLQKRGFHPDWRLEWIHVRYRGACSYFRFFDWIRRFDEVYYIDRYSECGW